MSASRFLATVRGGASLLVALGLLLRLGLKDRIPALAVLSYLLQFPVLAGVCALTGALTFRSFRRRASLAWLGAAGVMLALWWGTRGVWHPCGDAGGDFQVLEWNTAHGFTGWPGIVKEIGRADAQMVALVEADAAPIDTERFWREHFPGYAVRSPGRGMVLMVKGEIAGGALQEFGLKSRLAVFEVRLGGQALRVLLVDLEANTLSKRRPLVEKVAAVASEPYPGPTLIAGDFNTPADSVWLEALRRGHREAFETAGRGILATWPVPLPLLQLDQIWVSGGLTPVCAGKRLTWRSDHAPVWADVAFSAR